MRYYQICVDRYPNYPRRAEILLRIAEINYLRLNNYREAKKLIKKLFKDYPETRWEKLARGKIKDCFPLSKGNFWLEGDSKTGGKNYLAKIFCLEPYRVVKKVYAGKRLVTTINLTYKKGVITPTGSELWEYEISSPEERLIFCYPLKIGDIWFSGDGLEKVIYTVVSREEEVKTKTGEFSDCLKIRQEKKSTAGSFRYDYYAPGMGRVLVTQASLRNPKEVWISELLSYKITEE